MNWSFPWEVKFIMYFMFQVDIGQHISILDTLPPLYDEGKLLLIPNKILRTRERRL